MKEIKTIGFYIGDLGRGGAERVISNLANYFDSKGFRVIMVTKLQEDKEYPLNPGIIRVIADITPEETVRSRALNLIARIRKLSALWKKYQPDIIVSFIRKNNLMALASGVPLHIPVVVSLRSAPSRELKGRIFEPLSKFMFGFAAGIVVQTGEAADYFKGRIRKKIKILPNSLNPAFVLEAKTVKPLLQRNKEIILVGRIDNNKNQKMVLEVFRDLQQENSLEGFTLHLYGDGEDRDDLEKQYGGDGIYFHGRVEQIAPLLANSQVFVLPSRVEGMPNALLEAMTLGLCCISTDCPCGGPRDVIENDVNGILIKVDDKIQLKEKLKLVLSKEDLRDKLGNNAKAIIDRLDPEVVNKSWREYLESL